MITDLEPEEGLAIYRQRMKVEECFKDLKDLLSLEKIMNKKQENMEKMVAMVLMAYALGLLVGEELRDLVYGPVPRDGGFESSEDQLRGKNPRPEGKRWHLYSGLFVLLKQKVRVDSRILRQLVNRVLEFFRGLILGDVRTHI